MEEEDKKRFVEEYRKMLYTRHSVAQMGIPTMEAWRVDKAAKLMAILRVWGNNEGFTLSPKFIVDREYIQDIYGIKGGSTPDPLFADCLKHWVALCEAVKDDNDPLFVECAKWIKEMYDFKLIC